MWKVSYDKLIDKALELSIKKQIIKVNPLPQHTEKEVVMVITYMFGDLDFCMEKKKYHIEKEHRIMIQSH